jgi:hypothetical protein
MLYGTRLKRCSLGALIAVATLGACSQPAPRPDEGTSIDARTAAMAAGNEQRCTVHKPIGSHLPRTICRTAAQEAMDAVHEERLLRRSIRPGVW